jgi:hypothetical protein
MSTLSARANGPFAAAPGTKLLGEVITWSCSGVAVRHADLVAALRGAGLDESVARELAPRNAFARACKRLSERRVIRQLSESAAVIMFQFTRESREEGRFAYELEALLTLDKQTGEVSCDRPELAERAQALLAECLEARGGADVTRLIQRLFEREADLFPIRDRGGCYFCPAEHAGFLDRVDRLVSSLGGRLGRFPVPAGTPHGDRSVKEAVAAGLGALVAEHAQAVEALGEDCRPDTLERAAERIKRTRFKLEAYGELLAEERARLERELALARARLRLKVEGLAAPREAAAEAPL